MIRLGRGLKVWAVILFLLAIAWITGSFSISVAALSPWVTQYKEDFNGDGVVNVEDAVFLLLLARDNPVDPRLDYNRDSKWSMVDIVALILNIRNGNLTAINVDPPIPALSGEKLFTERCLRCHRADQFVSIYYRTKDLAGWQSTISRHSSVQLTADEQTALLTYLYGSSLLEQRCTMCHNLDRVTAAVSVKDQTAWTTTVDNMISKGAKLDSTEKDSLLRHLVALRNK